MTLLRAVLVVSLLAGLAFGQAQSSSGDIKGTVLDATGAVITNATATLSNAERGINRTAQTDESGEYRFPLVPPGRYRIRLEAAGFTVKVLENVEVRVGDTVTLKTELAVGEISTEVNVMAQSQTVEPERTQQANTLQFEQIHNLPINRRNYLDFALLAPGVVEANDIVDGTDYRVAQTPHSGLSFGGSNGRGNAFAIDGVDNSYNSGGVRPSLSQEAVQEFQINRNSMSAEFGGATGGAINIVSKAGTNEVHGNFFGFLRHRSIQARNYFDPGKSAFTRGQYGATFGAPIKKDRTFLFTAFERLGRRETSFVPILQDRTAFGRLTPSQQQLADFFDSTGSPQLKALSGAMRYSLVANNYPRTVALFNNNSGNFPFKEDTDQFSLRLDHRFTDRHSLFSRGSVSKLFNENTQFGALIGFNRGRSIEMTDATLMVSDTYLISQQWVSETRAAFGYNRLDVIPVDPYGPEINITGYGSFGREIFLPSAVLERHWQLQQNMNYLAGRHGIKFGADIHPVKDVATTETFFSGRFSFGENVPLAQVLNQAAGDPNFATGLVSLLTSMGKQSLVPNVMAPLTALQAYSLGLPTFYQQGFGSPNWKGWSKRYNFFLQDSWRVHRRLMVNWGARYELEANEKILGTDTNNIAPRFGFAWTPFAGGHTVIRGGYGMFYSQINLQIANIAESLAGTQIAQVFVPLSGLTGFNNPLTGKPLTSADIYQRLLGQGVIGKRSIVKEDLAQFNIVPNPNLPFAVVFGIDDNFENPYAHQASFEIEHAIGSIALSAGYSFNRTAHIVRILDRNLYYGPRRADGNPTFGFYNPLLFQKNIFESSANSFYHALVLQASKRFAGHYAVNVHYTFSKAMDEVTDFNTDFQPHDQLNARAERALSSFHQAHRVVANAVFQSPLTPGRGKGVAANLFGDFTLSPILVASSWRPFNVLAGFDNLGDRHPNTHRPLGAGRNIGQGPGLFTFDMRLGRKFPFGADGKRNVEFTAEGFNLLNRTNFKSLNNTVGNVTLESLPRPLTGVRGAPTSPLSFTSAMDPRQFQFGLKINY